MQLLPNVSMHCLPHRLPPPTATSHRMCVCLALPCFPQVADLPSLKQRMAELEEAAGASDLWDQRARATAVLQQLTVLREEVAALERFWGQLEDLGVAVELLGMEVRHSRQLMQSLVASTAVAGCFLFASCFPACLPVCLPACLPA